MMFQYFALLDRFNSDDNELDLSYDDRTLKISKIPRKTLEGSLLLPEPSFFLIKKRTYSPRFSRGMKRVSILVCWISHSDDLTSVESAEVK